MLDNNLALHFEISWLLMFGNSAQTLSNIVRQTLDIHGIWRLLICSCHLSLIHSEIVFSFNLYDIFILYDLSNTFDNNELGIALGMTRQT